VAAIRLAGLASVFALQVLLARLMIDTAEYGRYAWGQSLLFLVGAVAAIGLPLAAARFVASLDALGNFSGSRAVIRHSRRLLLRSTTCSVLLGLLPLLWWRDALTQGHYRDVTVVALLLAPLVTFAMFQRDIARARQWLVLAMLPLQVIRPIITALLALGCWWLLDNALAATTVLALAGLSLILILLPQGLLYHRRQARLHNEVTADAVEYQPARLLGTAFPIFLTRSGYLAINYSNVLLVGALAGPAAAGAYFAAERLAQLSGVAKHVVSTINQQSMAAAHATGRTRELQWLATQSAHGSLWPTLAAGTLLILLATPLLQLFGDDFTGAQTVLVILVLSGFFGVLIGPAQDLLIMTGRQRYIPRVMVFTALVHVLALLLLVPPLGAVGAATASLISSLVGQLWLLSLARRETGVDPTVLASLRGPPRPLP